MIRNLLLIIFSILLFSFSFKCEDKKIIGNHLSDSVLVVKEPRFKKSVVKIYPNPSFGKINISTNNVSSLHFYIFDLEGTMIYQTILNNKAKKNIDNLRKGTYLYNVFEKDESVEEGKIIVK
ncbi:MAG: T9SS type A sorting domain-containing protein [Flavisolibacter sp.]